jgi:hypothetical protein
MANHAHHTEPLISESVIVRSEQWHESEGRYQLLNERHNLAQRLANAATGYDAATLAAFLKTMVIDLQRLKDDLTDYTPILFHEVTNSEATDPLNLRDYMYYVGREDIMQGSGDTVPLIDHNLPVDVVVHLNIKAFGDKTTFKELVLNPFYKTELLIESAARILVDGQNKDSIGAIVSATYDAAHSQAADTSGATKDIKLYNTVYNAIDTAEKLYNTPTGKQNGLMAHKVIMLVNPIDLKRITPIINGGLERLAGINQIVSPLPIDEIIPYGGGLNDGLKWGNEILKFPGVAAGSFYIVIKNDVYGAYKIIKRTPTMEMGEGDVLALTTEKRAWHRIDGVFTQWLLPSTAGGKPYGAVVKGTLPA